MFCIVKPREVNKDPIHQINGVRVEIPKSKDEPKTISDHPANGARDEGTPNLDIQPPLNGAGDEGSPNLDAQPPVNGAGDEGSPNLDTQPPVNGAGDEGSRTPERKYDSVEIPADIDTRMLAGNNFYGGYFVRRITIADFTKDCVFSDAGFERQRGWSSLFMIQTFQHFHVLFHDLRKVMGSSPVQA